MRAREGRKGMWEERGRKEEKSGEDGREER